MLRRIAIVVVLAASVWLNLASSNFDPTGPVVWWLALVLSLVLVVVAGCLVAAKE